MRSQKSNSFKIFASLCLALLLISLALGCAYYNTFYNAQKFYHQAEKERLKSPEKEPSSSTLALYDKAIKKASKLLVFHPKSKWVDDSLLLLGKAFYQKGDYPQAARKFAELEVNYPQSEFLEEARYWQAVCLWKMKSYAEATEIFQRIAAQNSRFSVDALLASAQMAIEQRLYSKAVETLQKAEQKVSDQKELAQIFYWTGESHLALKQYPQAIKAFRQAIQIHSDPETEFKTRFKIGQCLEESGQTQQALNLYTKLLRDEDYYSHAAELTLQIAHCHKLLGDFPRALKDYRRVADDHPATQHSAAALYQMGIIYQSKLDSLERAQQCFKKVEQENRHPETVRLSRLREANIEKLRSYQAAKNTSPDSLFLLAELYLFEFSLPDSALAEYQRILEQFPENPLAPKAAYGVGWIYKTSLQDTARANQVFRTLLEKYPTSQYACTAREELGLKNPGKEIFLQAEKLRLDGAAPKSYLLQLKRLTEQYPESPYVPKAEYLIAWTYEYILSDSLSAHQAYEKLAQRFPDTQPGRIASEKLGLGKETKAEPETTQKENPPGTPDENRPRTRKDPIEP
ncbi:MAG: tetratricopeptide repeat protein [Candidatus Latescibacteria bacterium]|nr:tetratricopeptide repeat protein [Candidatus Latescibacterota bacterium]